MKNFHTHTGPRKLRSSTVGELIDLLYYLLDLSCTINRLFAVYPPARTIFFEARFHFTQVCSMSSALRSVVFVEQAHQTVRNLVTRRRTIRTGQRQVSENTEETKRDSGV